VASSWLLACSPKSVQSALALPSKSPIMGGSMSELLARGPSFIGEASFAGPVCLHQIVVNLPVHGEYTHTSLNLYLVTTPGMLALLFSRLSTKRLIWVIWFETYDEWRTCSVPCSCGCTPVSTSPMPQHVDADVHRDAIDVKLIWRNGGNSSTVEWVEEVGVTDNIMFVVSTTRGRPGRERGLQSLTYHRRV
jgi:hypothetical protein